MSAALADRVRDAQRDGRPLRVRGIGSWMSAGRPVGEAETISLADDRGIVEYVPGDLTLTARAGTPLSEIGAATRAHGQWLPLDPWGGDGGTLGATLSTATAGPHAYAMGLPRDLVLGLEFVTGKGDVVRAGGRVVKNVAGFDLARMVIGSWGTLGVITEATLRLRARPDTVRSVAIAVPGSSQALSDVATRLRALPFVPLASEVMNAYLASRLGIGSGSQPSLLVQLGGNQKSVSAQLDLIAGLGTARDVEETVWPRLRASEPDAAATWRWSHLPSHFGETWTAAERALRDGSLDGGGACIHGNPARGVVRVSVPVQGAATAAVARAATHFAHTVVVERLPKAAWDNVGRVAADPLSRAIRAKFDPGGILNPGILAGPAS